MSSSEIFFYFWGDFELLTCCPHTTEALFSTFTCGFAGKAQLSNANFAFVALQSLTCVEKRDGWKGVGGTKEEEKNSRVSNRL